MHDLRYAARVLLRAPGFTALAATVLALGVGANSAIFSVVDAALLRPLPYHKPDRLVMLWEHAPGYIHNRTSPLNFLDWHDRNTVFAAMAAVSGGSRTLQTANGAERIPGQSVTQEFFSLLRIPLLAGRAFGPDDDRTRADVVVIGERLWHTRFSGDPAIVGRTIPLDGKPFTVIGVAPARFQILYESDLWTLMTPKRSPEQRRMHYLQVLGRLKPGVTIDQARSAMAVIAAQIAQISPATNKDWSVTIDPLRESIVGAELRTTSLVLAGVVLFILLMACANVASLMLARGAARAREMAVRAALGAGGTRLAKQVLTESLLLSALGGAGGLGLGWILIRLAPRLIPEDGLPAGLALSLDPRVLAFTTIVSLGTGLLFALAPMWQLSKGALAGAMRGGGRGVALGHTRLLAALAMAEIAIAVVVVSGAGLFLRTLERLSQVDPGFHAGRVLTMRVSLPLSRYPTTAHMLAFYQAAQSEIESLPGVRSASFGGSLPLTGFDIGQGVQIVGQAETEEGRSRRAHYQMVGARYFETLGIPLQAGRAFSAHDDGASQQVAIVNQEFVRRYLNGETAVGTHIRVSAMEPAGPRLVEREIVGVVGQVKVDGLGETENTIEVYVPLTQNAWDNASIAVRASGDPLALTTAVKAVIAKFDKQLAVTNIRTMEEIAAESVARPRFRARLVGGFAALALLLSAVGIFGVLAFSVGRRKREFGIRMALGAQVADVLSLVLAGGVRIAAAGVVAGLVGAAVLARSLAALLFGIDPLDGVTFASAAALLAAVALVAASIPAWRAARVDPAIALRDE
jgi:putative ABC transport system permease protein